MSEETKNVQSCAAIVDRMLGHALATYDERSERVAMRSALGDAAHLCDVVAKEIRESNRHGKRVTKTGLQLAAIATRCGDAIWAMRFRVDVPGASDTS